MSRTYRRKNKEPQSYYFSKAAENYWVSIEEHPCPFTNRLSLPIRGELEWWEKRQREFYQDGKDGGTYCFNLYKKGLKRQTRRARRRDEKRYIQKYMKGETDDIPNFEKLYLGYVWNWD